ncbi:MAG: amidohydrolase family protein [Rhizobacter sp.]|nr:amidohydrolase family protein [Rhizobacter sp.]
MSHVAPDAPPDCAAPQAVVRAPRRRLPRGACDCHIHVFGDRARYPLDPRRNYTPHVATLDEHRAVMAACGIARAVLVQPSVYGTDNACLLDALREGAARGDAYRGIVVPEAGVSDQALAAIDALGVRGIRLNVVNPQMLAIDDAVAIGKRMRSRAWHLQVHLMLAADGASTLARLADRVDVPIVVDHFGRPGAGAALPRLLLDLVASGRVWVKLSAAYRLCARAESAHADLGPLVDALVAANPARLLWGSDWPHTELRATPHEADLVDLLVATLPDVAVLRRVCVDNPASLYGFRAAPP